VNTQFWVVQAFNGVSYGALLFLVGAGLSLIFGVMRIVNLSHGSYFLLGGYVALSVIWITGSWALSIPIAVIAIALVGLVMERLFLRPEGRAKNIRDALIALGIALIIRLSLGRLLPQMIPGQIGNIVQVTLVVAIIAVPIYLVLQRISAVAIEADTLRQVLMTVGFAFLFQQAALDLWSGNPFDISPPPALTQSVSLGGMSFPLYRLFMIVGALVIGILLWLAMEKTRMGAMVRATVDDAQMARGVGIDTNKISMFIFALGAGMAALGGVIGGAFLGVYPGLDFEMLPIAFAVVIIGGMGSLGGAAIGALLVGLADNFGKALFPELAYFTLYAPMVLILALKPTGLFGRD